MTSAAECPLMLIALGNLITGLLFHMVKIFNSEKFDVGWFCTLKGGGAAQKDRCNDLCDLRWILDVVIHLLLYPELTRVATTTIR